MPSLKPPTSDELDAFTLRLVTARFTYEPGLLDRADDVDRLPRSFPRGWFVDRHRSVIGHGRADFAAACDALRQWRQFGDDWLRVGNDAPRLRVDAEIGYAARVLGVWWSYGCRIVSVIDEPRRFGFVYGTIGNHAERGEEQFLIDFDPNGDVVYSLFALSRPSRWFAWPGMPIARAAQARFRRRSTVTMKAFVADRRRVSD